MNRMFNSKKILTFGAAAAMTASAAFAAAPGNRTMYAFTLGTAELANENIEYDWGFVSYPFDPTETDGYVGATMLQSYSETPTRGIYAGAGVDGLIYACEYEAAGLMESPVPTYFVVYNTFNGLREEIGLWNPEQTDFKVQDMTWSEKDQKMYAVGYEKSSFGLYEVDLKTGKFTFLGKPANGGATIAAAPNGDLYSLNSSGALYIIKPDERFKASFVMNTGLSGMLNHQSMEFDKASGKLYWISNTQEHYIQAGDQKIKDGYEDSWLQEIDVNAKTIREVSKVGINARIVALHIPSCERLDAPAAPSNVKSEYAENGDLKATLSWKNPETAFDGGELGSLYGFYVYRNGEKVYDSYADKNNGPFNKGEEMSWTDTTIPAHGEYRYDVVFVGAKGDGAKGTVYQYIGPDAPGFVSHIKGEVADGAKSITLTWDAPTAGRHLGAYDASKTLYKVVRNDGTVVADKLTECKATDADFVRVMQYTYTVTAYNESGASDLLSGSFILGPALRLPQEFTFEDNTKTQNLWSYEDINNDGFSWMFNTTLGQQAFGDYESCAEYLVSPGMGNGGKANEWLLTPPMKIEAGIEYEITLSTRSYTQDQFEIWMGNKNESAAMTEKLGEFSIDHDPNNADIDPAVGTVAFRRRSVAIPVQTEDATKCFGIHLTTDTSNITHSFFQINGVYVGEKGEYSSGVEDIIADASEAQISLNGKVLTIFGSFKSADLYDLNGRKVLSTESAIVDLSSFATGVYVLSIDGNSFKLAL